MALAPGTRLGSYEILSLIGSGGMGEVYRARDSRLNRDVAIKVLPSDVAADHDRLARFEREAQVLASLNHPNIAAIHGVDDSSGTPALVMELVDGPTLADRIAKGPIPLDEALPIAKQIAEALEAAHEKGIIHRDLKPANIKVRPDGTVKILDFGLAKAFDPVASTAGNATMSPTLSVHATQTGIILGTAAYMAPEQARGRAVDKRTDIWAFGCVLYEMLAGRRVFDGDDISTTLAAVIRADPEWSALASATPLGLQRLLRQCLQKDPRRRLQAIGDARVRIEDLAAGASEDIDTPSTVRVTPWWRRAMPAAIGAASVGLIAGVAWMLKPQPPVSVVRFPIVLPEDQRAPIATPRIAFAPDGTRLAYLARGRLYVRALNEMDARLVTDATQDATGEPFFSPDGQWIGFYSTERTLKKVALTGGALVTICKVEGAALSATWEGDRILFFQPGKGILQVPANGGDAEVLIALGASEVADTPQLLDGGTAVLFTVPGQGGNRWDGAQVVVQSVGSHERKVVWRGGSAARYLPSGHLVYAVGNVLFAVPFDLKRREVRGAPVPVVEGVLSAVSPSGALVQTFAVSRNGSLIYVPGGVSAAAPSRLALVGRDGSVHPLGLPPQPYHHPRISPDGQNLVFETDNGKEAVVWVYGLSGGGPPRQLTFGGRNRSPIWTPDGRRVTFTSDRDGGGSSLFWQAADGSGTAERLLKGEATTPWRPEAWTPDGKTLAFGDDAGVADIWTLTLGGESKPKKLVESPANKRYTEFSRDGRWFAYSSAEARPGPTSFDIFVQPFPPTGAKYRLTTTGARTAAWSPDGKELFYTDSGFASPILTEHLVAVGIRTQPTFSFGKPTPLPIGEGVQFVGRGRQYDITPDGKQFVVVLDASTSATPAGTSRPTLPQINVVVNWVDELKQRVPVK